MKDYDVVVIGAGSGGLTVAYTAKGFGKTVLLIDKNKPGGECTWYGCVPSKALINEAQKVYNVRQYVDDYQVDTSIALKHVDTVRREIYAHEDPPKLKEDGIDYLEGQASFMDKNTLLVKDTKIRGKKIFISSGSAPFVPPIDGIDSISYLTNESLFELKVLPKSIIILGGGAIGVEMAQALNRLGVQVELVEMMETILFREESSLVHALQSHLAGEGVSLNLGQKAIKVEKDQKIRLTCESVLDKGSRKIIEGEAILVAIGRQPNIQGLDLEEGGIDYNSKGIIVDKYLRTSNKSVYAVGDVVGPYQFSHMANVQGILATKNALLPIKSKINYNHVAWVTFTKPELARAGLTEEEARDRYGDSIRVYDYDFNDLDRAKTKGQTIESLKLILDKKGKTLGASILSDRAGEMIGEVQVLKSLGHNFKKMANVIHPYPTYSEVFTKIGKKVMIDNIMNHPLVKLFRR